MSIISGHFNNVWSNFLVLLSSYLKDGDQNILLPDKCAVRVNSLIFLKCFAVLLWKVLRPTLHIQPEELCVACPLYTKPPLRSYFVSLLTPPKDRRLEMGTIVHFLMSYLVKPWHATTYMSPLEKVFIKLCFLMSFPFEVQHPLHGRTALVPLWGRPYMTVGFSPIIITSHLWAAYANGIFNWFYKLLPIMVIYAL